VVVVYGVTAIVEPGGNRFRRVDCAWATMLAITAGTRSISEGGVGIGEGAKKRSGITGEEMWWWAGSVGLFWGVRAAGTRQGRDNEMRGGELVLDAWQRMRRPRGSYNAVEVCTVSEDIWPRDGCDASGERGIESRLISTLYAMPAAGCYEARSPPTPSAGCKSAGAWETKTELEMLLAMCRL
jgi:hypothetical protein